MMKYIFLLLVAFLAIFLYLYNTFISDSDAENELDNMFDSKVDNQENDFNIDDYDSNFDAENELDDESNEEDVNTNSNHSEVAEDDEANEEEDHEIPNEFNYEANYIERFGEGTFKISLSSAEKLIRFFLRNDNNYEKIEGEVTEEYLSALKNQDRKDQAKKINALEIFPAEPINDDEIIIGVVADYDDRIELFNIVFVQKDDVFLIDEIVSMWMD